MKQYTDITVLLDRSGSMSSIKESMESAYNSFINEHKVNKSTRITLVQFDDITPNDVVYQNVPIEAAEKLNLKPRGNTPLIDAMCRTIDRTGERLASLDESERPDQVLFVVITDGAENASTTYKRSDVASRVHKQHDTYKWNFIYLGANQDSFAEAASFGITPQWVLNYNATKGGVGGASAGLIYNTVNYASQLGNERTKSRSLAFTNEQRKQAVEENN